MLTTTKPRSPPPRVTHTPQSPIASFESLVRPSSQTTIRFPSSLPPPKSPPRGRRPSLSNTMHWLSRTSTSSAYAPSKPTRISEPKMTRSIELLTQRTGVLGSGATVVRTPDEALRETGVRLTFDGKAGGVGRPGDARHSHHEPVQDLSSEHVTSPDNLPSPPTSPPLPPLPLPQEEESSYLEGAKVPPRPTRAPPPAPTPAPSLRPSLKPTSIHFGDEPSCVPALPANISASPPPPDFRPILISDVPTGAIDPSKIIVTLETCTTTYRTALDTIKSRPSYLSSYIASLFPRSRNNSITSSIYSNASDDMSAYRHHLASQGLLPQSSFSIHVFLDRPSAPYAHILSYLRSPPGSPLTPESLPRAAQLHSSSHTRLEALLELRDEAAFLGLEGLHKLCMEELRLRQSPRLHTRGNSASTNNSVHSLHASVYSLHTLLERVESDMRPDERDSKSSDSHHNHDTPNEMGGIRSPPTPLSWNGRSRTRSQTRHSPSRSPPAGWI